MPDWLTDSPGAELAHVAFGSGGETLHAVLMLPGGTPPHPAAVILHGIPGWEANGDLAHTLARAGRVVLVPHYRGSWGMPGRWSWAHTLEDAASAVDLLLDEQFAAEHGIDPTRVAVIGHSLGGFLALMTAARRPRVVAVASLAGFDFGTAAGLLAASPDLRRAYERGWDEDARVLTGTSGEALVAELEAAGPAWSLRALAPDLADRAVLLVAGERDTLAPPAVHHEPLARALREAGGRPEALRLDTGHSFADKRLTVAGLLVDFLDSVDGSLPRGRADRTGGPVGDR